MIHRTLITLLLFVAMLPAALLIQEKALADGTKPNVIFIVLDDAGYQDFVKHQTDTNIDHSAFRFLERWALKFTHFYTNPTCSPTRMSLMTGKNPASFGVEHALCVPDSQIPNDPFGSARGIPRTEMTIVKKLNSAGYRTAHVGKWHIGERPGKRTKDQGYHDTLVYRYDNHKFIDPYMMFYSGTSHTKKWAGKNKGVIKGHKTDLLTTYALKVIKEHKKSHKAKPLFLNLWYNAPHHPFTPKDEFVQNYGYDTVKDLKESGLSAKDIDLIKFKAVMDQIDHNLKRIIDHIKADNHFKKNTIIMLTSDNGGAAKKNNYSNTPLIGAKGKLTEGAVRLPLYVYRPGVNLAGKRNSTLLRSSDLLPTLTDLAGASHNFETEGVSFASLLDPAKANTQNSRSELIFWNQRGQIKYCKGKWSAFKREKGWNKYATWRQAIRDDNWKFISKSENGTYQEFLFDFSNRNSELETDKVNNSRNKVTSNPAKADEMRTKLYNAVIEKSQMPAVLQVNSGTASVSGSTMSFPGKNSSGGRVKIKKHDLYETHDGSFTFSLRVKAYDKSFGKKRTLAHRSGSWKLSMLGNGRIRLNLKGENYASNGQRILSDVQIESSTTLTAGQEYNVTFTVTGHVGNNKTDSASDCSSGEKKTFINNVARLYVDPVTRTQKPNVEAINATSMTNIAYSGYDNPVFVGRPKDNKASESFFGKIQLLGAFALPLTQEQLRHLYSIR